jgi:hypothetical protein
MPAQEYRIQKSIHPRVVCDRTMHQKVNTARPRRNGLSDKARTAIKKHLEAHPNDAASRQRLTQK